MKILITVASKHGSTREIAEAITEELRGSGLDADLLGASEVDSLEGYDAIILGSGIYAGSWLPEAKYFIEQYRPELSRMPIWLFSSGPLGENSKSTDDPKKLEAPLAGIEVREHKIFVGKLDPATLGLGERLIVKVVGAPAGDFRNWSEIRDWAKQIARKLELDSIGAQK
jgi:menaquinone-dependent protoporphyrinogen oxidase